MRQVLIAKNDEIKGISGDEFTVLSTRVDIQSIKAECITFYHVPVKVDVVTGGTVKLKFSLPKELAFKGVVLLGAYYEGGVIEAAFRSLEGVEVDVPEGTPILTVTLTETVRFRQISPEILGGMVLVSSGAGKSPTMQPKSGKKSKKK